jgi:uncharacterized protein YkvS
MTNQSTLNQAVISAQNLLQGFTLNQGFQSGAFTDIFGNQLNVQQLQLLEQEFSQRIFTSLPTVEILSSDDLGGALGAYALELDRIFLAQEFIDTATEADIVAVILEEYGHALERRINFTDNQGDEGFLFSALVRGVTLTSAELQAAQQENDLIDIVVDGQIVQAEGAIRVVTTLIDQNNGTTGGTSLREAIAAASSGDTITFSSGLQGTITLTLGQLTINKSLTIDGDTDNDDSTANISISGNNANRVFNINNSQSNLTVNLDGLTIINGNTTGEGGGIFNNGENVTIRNSTISGNTAAIAGGGIFNNGILSVTNSTINNNSAEYGGGIRNNQTATITNSTIFGNTAEFGGGGISNPGTATLKNSTVAGNFAGFGSGISNTGGVVTLTSAIVGANNNAATDLSGGTVNANNSLIEQITRPINGSNNIVGVDPLLDFSGLQNNGGATLTIRLQALSPALNAGSNPDNLTTDQRGFARNDGSGVDIGAVEMQPNDFVNVLEVTTLNDENNGGTGGAGLSLREALAIANSGNIITFASGLTGGTVLLSLGELVINRSLTIDGDINNDGIADITISGNNLSRVLSVTDGNLSNALNVNLDGLKITDGNISTIGAGIYNSGENLNINNSNLFENTAGQKGGAIYNTLGTVTLTNSNISDNSAVNSGGGISNETGRININNSTISGNTVNSFGGGIYHNQGTVTISNSAIADNSAQNQGGGVWNSSGTITINNSNISSNTANNNGGGLLNNNGTVTISNSAIADNFAGTDGGGINNNGSLTLTESTISGNTADQGGGLNNLSGTAIITNTTIADNLVTIDGGGIRNVATVNITKSTIADNSATNDGGGIDNSGGTATISNTTIFGNSASSGGGLNNALGTLSIKNSTISANSASSGGGLYNGENGISSLSSSLISGNIGTISGNEIFHAGSSIISDGKNLLGDNSQSNSDAFSNFTPNVGDITATTNGNTPKALNNILDPNGLQNNGGLTQTVALVSGSPAINAGSANGFTTDQRGVAFVGQTDIGAYEIVNNIVVDTLQDQDDGDFSEGDLSLREALKLIADGGTITFANSIANGTITLANGELLIDKSLTIDGDTNKITISGNQTSRVFNIFDSTSELNVTIDSLTITQGFALGTGNNGRGGGIFNNEETVTIVNSTFVNNLANTDGGGIFNQGQVNIINSTMFNNFASIDGGGISSKSGIVNVTNSTLYNNRASSDGGAIEHTGATVTIRNSTISGNTAAQGGGIYNGSAQTNLISTIVANNLASSNGNDLKNTGGTVNASNSLIEDVTGNPINGTNTANITGQDPLLDPNGLKDNGGATLTILLQNGSPALNAGSNPNGLLTDQRGFDRNDGNGVDIGAVELQDNEFIGEGDINGNSAIDQNDSLLWFAYDSFGGSSSPFTNILLDNFLIQLNLFNNSAYTRNTGALISAYIQNNSANWDIDGNSVINQNDSLLWFAYDSFGGSSSPFTSILLDNFLDQLNINNINANDAIANIQSILI